MQPTSKTVLILGANGRFGSHAVTAFAEAGWQVLAQTRATSQFSIKQSQPTIQTPAVAIQHCAIDLDDKSALLEQARKCSFIVHGLHPPYRQWDKQVPIITQIVLDLAAASGATLIVPGNVYNFGSSMPQTLATDTPHRPSNSLGVIRTNMELNLKKASHDGQQVIILRAGDFLQAQEGGNWFDSHLSKSLRKGKLTYPGRTDIIHAWCYLPDFARACVELAEIRADLPNFSDIPYEGTTLTAQQMAATIVKTLNRKVQLKTFPWWAIRLLSLFNNDMKCIYKMRYLWDTPHQLDGKLFRKLLPDFQATNTEEIIDDCVRRYA